MCTSIAMKTKDFYFGRNMDVAQNYYQNIVVTPRNYLFKFSSEVSYESQYAMIGMATVVDNYPLYAEATNEKGLSIAGLNFPKSAVYYPPSESGKNISPYELIPYLLVACESVEEVRNILAEATITNINFKDDLPLAPIHWMVSDAEESIVIESVASGLKVMDNKVGVLTNNPPFEYHLQNLNNYMNITNAYPDNEFSSKLDLAPYGTGLGGIGLPGDFSPMSRFVKTAFLLSNSVCDDDELASVTQFFHILDAVKMVRGSVLDAQGRNDITLYSSCTNTRTGTYYYKTYFNNQINAIPMADHDLDVNDLYIYDWIEPQVIDYIY